MYTQFFAFDEVVITHAKEDISFLARKLEDQNDKAGLEINFAKIEHLVLTKLPTRDFGIDEQWIL